MMCTIKSISTCTPVPRYYCWISQTSAISFNISYTPWLIIFYLTKDSSIVDTHTIHCFLCTCCYTWWEACWARSNRWIAFTTVIIASSSLSITISLTYSRSNWCTSLVCTIVTWNPKTILIECFTSCKVSNIINCF
jgi:hypothetical protein